MEEGLRVIKGVLLGCTTTAGESGSAFGCVHNSGRIKSSIRKVRSWEVAIKARQ